jgi:hypothetical protein
MNIGKEFTIEFMNEPIVLVAEFTEYQNGRTAILLHTDEGELFADLSVNLPDHEDPDQEQGRWIYARNYDLSKDILNALCNAGIIMMGKFVDGTMFRIVAMHYEFAPTNLVEKWSKS